MDKKCNKVEEVIQVINSTHNTKYRFVERFGRGEWGAYRIAETGKKPVVLKFFLNLSNTNIVDADPILSKKINNRLLSLDYPVPKYIYTGSLNKEGLYWVQEELPGKPLWENPTLEQVKKILSLLELQKNHAVSPKQNWSDFVKDTIFGHKTEKKTTLKNHSKETNNFLESIMLLIQGLEDLPLPTTDIVHGDFSYHNTMIKDGKITGIIDWQEAGCGDWLIDLARLIYSLHDRPKLTAPIIKKLKKQDIRRIKLYTVFTVLEMISWPIKFNPQNIENAFNKAKSAVDFVFVKKCRY
jgi:hypothetical protein